MPVQAHTLELAGVTWTLNSLGASDGLTVSGHIASILGSAVAGMDLSALETAEGQATDESGAGAVSAPSLRDVFIARIVAAVLGRMADPATSMCIKLMLKGLRKADGNVSPPGLVVAFDVEFSQNYGTLTKLIAWAIQFNFSSFFDARGEVKEYLQKIELPKPK